MRVIGRGITQSGMCFKNEINETEDSGNSLEPTIHSPRGVPMLCVQEPVIKEGRLPICQAGLMPPSEVSSRLLSMQVTRWRPRS